MQNRPTMREAYKMAKVVLYGEIANPKVASDSSGRGTTELKVLQVVKPHADYGNRAKVVLDRYLPVLDPKNPPRFLVFCDVVNGNIDGYEGRPVNSPELLKYLQGAKALEGKDRIQALCYFFPYLGHEDPEIAGDAFLEFSRASDQDVSRVAKLLPADKLRQLLVNPSTPPERLGLYGFLLGAAGHQQDAELLRAMIERPTARTRNALDGLLSGYIQLQPRAGWDKVVAILRDGKRGFIERNAAGRVLAFYNNARPQESRREIVRCLDVMLDDDTIADVGVNYLRQWRIWDLTAKVLPLFSRPSQSPLVKRAILRYALCCPQDTARRFVEQVRRTQPEMVHEVEQSLEFERGERKQ
jgi:hypothetical protein